jgi:prepilin-type N-terminal cleavage/methylation domain-containing protein
MKRDCGFTLVELLIVIAVIGIIAAIGLPGLMSARSAANESSAIASLRAISNAQILYSNACANGNFATDLTVLAVPPPASTLAFLPPDLTNAAVVTKSGYRFQLAPSAGAVAGPNDCNGSATRSGFYARAEPVTFGRSGQRSFATLSPLNTIWQVSAAVAPAEPFGAPAQPIQ